MANVSDRQKFEINAVQQMVSEERSVMHHILASLCIELYPV